MDKSGFKTGVATIGFIVAMIASLLTTVPAQAQTGVTANDDAGPGYTTRADETLVTPNVLLNDVAEVAPPTTLVETFFTDGNLIRRNIATAPSSLSSEIPPSLGTQASGTTNVSATPLGTSGVVDVSVNDTDFFLGSRIAGGYEGTVTIDDIFVSGPGTQTTFSARALVDAAVSMAISGDAGTLAGLDATVFVRATPPGGGATSRIARLGSIGDNIDSSVNFAELLQTEPLTIDTRFPVRVEVNLIASGRASSGLTTGSASTVNRTSAILGNGPDEDVFVVGDGFTVSSASAGIVDNRPGGGAEPPLVIQSIDTTGTQGAVTANGDGTFTYDPGTAFSGLAPGETAFDNFTYVAADSSGNTDSATVTIAISGVGRPVAVDDTYNIGEDATLVVTPGSGGLLDNDSHTGGLAFRVESVDDSTLAGTVTVSPDGGFTFTTASVGPTTFGYVIVDRTGATASATATIDVTPTLNQPPVGVDDAFSVSQDGVLTITAPGVLKNDSDPDGDQIAVAGLAEGVRSDGVVDLQPEGSFTFTPAAGFFGETQFAYTITDGITESAPVTVTITVEQPPTDLSVEVNFPDEILLPEADDPFGPAETMRVTVRNDGPNTAQDISIRFTEPVDRRFFDVLPIFDGDWTCSGSSLVTIGCGLVRDLAPGTNRSTSFRIKARANLQPGDYTAAVEATTASPDPNPDNNTAPITFTARLANLPPIAVDDTFSVSQDGRLTIGPPGVLKNDSDPDGDQIAVVGLAEGVRPDGTVDLQPDGSFTFAPVAGFSGETRFVYTITDGAAESAPAIVTITVEPPQADIEIDVGFPTQITLPDDGQALGPTERAVITITNNGPNPAPNLSLDEGSDLANGNFLISTTTPGWNCGGFNCTLTDPLPPGDTTTATFTLAATQLLNPATYTTFLNLNSTALDPNPDNNTTNFTFTARPANLPPVAVDDAFSVSQDETLTIDAPGLLKNDSDPDGDQIAVVGVAPGLRPDGTVEVQPDGSFVFVPDTGFSGETQFAYTITDGASESAPATVTITIAPPEADLSIDVSFPDELELPPEGDEATGPAELAAITLRNNGPDPARNVRIGGGSSFVDIIVDGGAAELSCERFSCQVLDDLQPGATITARFILRATPDLDPGDYTSTFTALSATTDPNLANNRAVATVSAIEPFADLSIEIDRFPDEIMLPNGEERLGPETTARVTVRNDGPNTAHEVRIIPGGLLNNTNFEIFGGDQDWSCSGFICRLRSVLRPGHSASVGVTLQPTRGLDPGDYTSSLRAVTSTFDPNADNNRAEINFTAVEPSADLSIAITSFPSELVLPEGGERYGPIRRVRISISNRGPNEAHDVRLSQGPGLSGLRIFPAFGSDGLRCGGASFGCELLRPPLLPGQTVNLIFDIQATRSLTAGEISSFLEVSSATLDPLLDNDRQEFGFTARPANFPPVAVNDAYEVVEDNVLVVEAPGLLANDSDPDGDDLAVELGRATNGTVTVGAEDGAFSYQPDDDFSGTDSISYVVDDGRSGTATAEAVITVVSAAEARAELLADTLELDGLTFAERRILESALRPFGAIQSQLKRLDVYDRSVVRLVRNGVVDLKTALELLKATAALREAIQ